ncbi:hypothetical protein K0817_018405 [Microbacterium sp. HD4P20]|uniref:hypothetical protein n=1 Tax=Microbacterium sp. HD4P20 TaxID=2864874 RepID=UPI001C63EE9E|nr:hypothetical protein [Microbacterium sp. HD4P20]MCP2638530.1 hypothetical protein [Microbacterium sp. HD4P20]
MTVTPAAAGLALAGDVVAADFEGWSDAHLAEFRENAWNGRVGHVLLLETDRVRIWRLSVGPGERVAFHRHVLDYFWTAVTSGRSRQHSHDGTTREVAYEVGTTRSFVFAEDQYLLHDLENIGEGRLEFVTVEFLRSANPPLTLS